MIGKSPHKNPATSSSTSRDSWAKVRLGDICGIVRGVSYKKDQASQNPEEGRVPVLRATNIQGSTLVLDSDLVYVPSTVVSDEQMLQVGDIVVATSSGSKHLVGKTAQVKQAWEGSFGAFCATLRPRVDINHRYLGYFFSTQEYKDYISKKALGVNINNLRRGDLEEISVPVPPPEQQKLIVAEIEKQFSRLDEAVANLKRIKANLKRYKAAVLKAAVEGKLTEDWRKANPDVEPASKLLERILTARRSKWNGKGKYKEPDPPDVNNLHSLPEKWAWTTVEQLSEISSGNTPKGIEGFLSAEGEVPWFKVGDMNRPGNEHVLRYGESWLSRASAKKLNLRIFPPGAVIFPKRGGAIATNKKRKLQADTCLDLNLMAITGIGDVNAYLFLWFRSVNLAMLSDGSNVPQINHKDIAPLPVQLPPIHEQEEIVAEVEGRLSVIDQLQTTVEANLTRAARLRQAFLGKAFSGQLHLEGKAEILLTPGPPNEG